MRLETRWRSLLVRQLYLRPLEIKTMSEWLNLNYIECAGVRVPSDWSVEQLAEALAKRKIRFANEKEIMSVFGDAIRLKSSLENEISRLQAEVAKWDRYVKEKQEKARCPGCGVQWTEPAAAPPPANKAAAKKTR